MDKYILGSVEDFLRLGDNEHYHSDIDKYDWQVYRYGDTENSLLLIRTVLRTTWVISASNVPAMSEKIWRIQTRLLFSR